MGPAILITLGVLFLLDQITHVHWLDFGSTWPAFLIVMGLVLFLEHSASAAGHVPRQYGSMPPAAPGNPGYPGQLQPPMVTPPPVPPAASITPGADWSRTERSGGAQWLALVNIRRHLHQHSIRHRIVTAARLPDRWY